MVVPRSDPLRQDVVTELRAIIDVWVALPHVTVQREHLRSTRSERVRHAEPDRITNIGFENRRLRILVT